MLHVTKIIEGGIDLQTQRQLPRSLVISNGFREIEIPVSDNDLAKVVSLFADKGPISMSAQVVEQPAPRVPDVAEVARQVHPTSPQPVFEKPASPFEEEEEEGFDDDGFEPGEEYADLGTGAGSL